MRYFHSLVSDFEQVHALATANLLVSTQRDIALQLEEEEEANAKSRAKPSLTLSDAKKAKHFPSGKHIKRLEKDKDTDDDEDDKIRQNHQHGGSSLTGRIEQKTKSSVSRHIRIKPFDCKSTLVCSFDGCSRKFAYLNHLKYHELTHTNDRQYKCHKTGCDKTFFTSQHLQCHLRTHTGERPFKCDHENCGKTFTTAGNFKNHQRLHTGEQPYVCDEAGCDKKFTERSSLTKHKITHSGDKPFECNLCGKKFTQSGSRRKHLLRHNLDEEIKASLKQQVATSKVENSTAHCASSSTGGSETCADIRNGSGDVMVVEGHHATHNDVNDGGVGDHADSSCASTVVDAVSCAPQVLVLSNSYSGLPTSSEPVVFTHGEHIVTVTTQPFSMLHSHDYHDPSLERKTEELVVLSEETIYEQAGDHPSGNIIYKTELLDHEGGTHADYNASHVHLAYHGDDVSTDYAQDNNSEMFAHQGLSDPGAYVGEEGCELTITEYIEPGNPTYHLGTEKQHSDANTISGISHEESRSTYANQNTLKQNSYQIDPDKRTLDDFSQSDEHQSVYFLEAQDETSCLDDFIGAEVIAIDHQSVNAEATDYVCVETSDGVEVAQSIEHSNAQFSGEGMDPMMECDDELL